MLSPLPPAMSEVLLPQLSFLMKPIVELELLLAGQIRQHSSNQATADIVAALVAWANAILAHHGDRPAVVEDDGVASCWKKRGLVHAIFLLDDLVNSFPAKTNVGRTALRIHKIANFQVAAKHFATMAADFSVAPFATRIEDDLVATPLPEHAMISSRWVNVNP